MNRWHARLVELRGGVQNVQNVQKSVCEPVLDNLNNLNRESGSMSPAKVTTRNRVKSDRPRSPPYIRWIKDGRGGTWGSWHSQIKVKDGRFLTKNLYTRDADVAQQRIALVIRRYIAAGDLDPNSKVAKLYCGSEPAALRADRPILGQAEIDTEISRLAALSLAAYDNQCRDAARHLGLSITILDGLVRRERTIRGVILKGS
jgi:hypothetical protein